MTHPKSYDYIPPGLYRFLVNKSGQHRLGIKELKIMFMRDWCLRLGYKCEHPHDRITNVGNDADRPYCKECWTRLQRKVSKIIENGRLVTKIEYIPNETFVDRLNQGKKEFDFSKEEVTEMKEQFQEDLR